MKGPGRVQGQPYTISSNCVGLADLLIPAQGGITAGRDDKGKRQPKLFLPLWKGPTITDCRVRSRGSGRTGEPARCRCLPGTAACTKDVAGGTGPCTPRLAQPAQSRWQAEVCPALSFLSLCWGQRWHLEGRQTPVCCEPALPSAAPSPPLAAGLGKAVSLFQLSCLI